MDVSAKSEEKIVFFDGVCGLCNSLVDLALAKDRHQKLLFTPLQGESAKEVLSSHLREDLSTVVYYDKGRIFLRSTAALKIVQEFGGLWRLSGVLLLVPPFIRDAIYAFVARNRYQWFGKKEICRLPTQQERQRFLP